MEAAMDERLSSGQKLYKKEENSVHIHNKNKHNNELEKNNAFCKALNFQIPSIFTYPNPNH
jgi:hypothetical protein